jgi:predicted TIM-barrel fold metal-dependent hydrolase
LSRRRKRHLRAAPSPSVAAPVPGRFDVHLHLSRHWPDLAKNSYAPRVEFNVPGLLSEMDAAGVEGGLLLAVPESPSVEDNLEEGRALAAESGGRLHRVSTVDPTRGADAVAHAVQLWEADAQLRALKLFPGYQSFYPHDRRLDPLYEFAARRRLVVMIHQGDTLDPDGLLKFARPLEVDEVAVRFREVSFVLCHLGNPWIDECAELLYKNPNVYADTSGLLPPERSPRFGACVEQARDRLAAAIDTVGDVSKFLYGSDWPLESIRAAVGLVEGLRLPESDRRAVLGENARRLFFR